MEKNYYKIIILELDANRQVGWPSCACEYNVKMNLKNRRLG